MRIMNVSKTNVGTQVVLYLRLPTRYYLEESRRVIIQGDKEWPRWKAVSRILLKDGIVDGVLNRVDTHQWIGMQEVQLSFKHDQLF